MGTCSRSDEVETHPKWLCGACTEVEEPSLSSLMRLMSKESKEIIKTDPRFEGPLRALKHACDSKRISREEKMLLKEKLLSPLDDYDENILMKLSREEERCLRVEKNERLRSHLRRLDPKASSEPESDIDNLDDDPEVQKIKEMFNSAPPLCDRPTVMVNGKKYFLLPASMSMPSTALVQRLKNGKRCSNCADADELFPKHFSWKNCPHSTSRREETTYPLWHSPVESIANGGVSPKKQPLSPNANTTNETATINSLVPNAPNAAATATQCLLDMGFELADIKWALGITGGDLAAAITMILSK